MTLAVDYVDGHGYINTASLEHLPKRAKVTRYWLQKNYQKDGALCL